jgi:ubiquinone/menaquinone biosynthesis C-methylase UbiE
VTLTLTSALLVHLFKEAGVSNVEYVVGSALELPFPDHHFDGVVMSDVIGTAHRTSIPRMCEG